jgi:hypothetical protein
LPGDVVVKGALCGTPKTLYFTHLHSNGKKYIFCSVIQAKTNLQLQNKFQKLPWQCKTLYPEKSARTHETHSDTFFKNSASDFLLVIARYS